MQLAWGPGHHRRRLLSLLQESGANEVRDESLLYVASKPYFNHKAAPFSGYLPMYAYALLQCPTLSRTPATWHRLSVLAHCSSSSHPSSTAPGAASSLDAAPHELGL